MLIGAWRRSKLDEKSPSGSYPEIFWPAWMLIGAWRRSKSDENIPLGLILRFIGLMWAQGFEFSLGPQWEPHWGSIWAPGFNIHVKDQVKKPRASGRKVHNFDNLRRIVWGIRIYMSCVKDALLRKHVPRMFSLTKNHRHRPSLNHTAWWSQS